MSDFGVPPTSAAGRTGADDVPTLSGLSDDSSDPRWAELDDGHDADGTQALPGEAQPPPQLARTMVEWVVVAGFALALALLIRTFLVQAYYIPSSSMADTLHEDDRVMVNKLSYRFGEVGRGDVIVFSKPDNAPGVINDFIKRVIALPGETISFAAGQVLIDGELQTEPYVGSNLTFANGQLLNCANNPPAADRCLVPEGMVFVMGDNREGSTDSRVFGPIDIDSIVGRAFIKLWPLGDIGFL
ncbi:MAG: signal peptidase I [Acidimicrobiaceae bacterium]|nr:signal peptidase I [Acidimicrobiia bacterium]MCY4493607.1 signal peptidase I [Acidimicrobiaceae bacterium]